MLSNCLRITSKEILAPVVGHNGAINIDSGKRGLMRKVFYNWPNNWLPFKWERKELQPIYFDTGDTVYDPDPYDPDKILPQYEDVKALESAPPVVKSLFTYRFLTKSDVIRLQEVEYGKEFNTRPFNDMDYAKKVIRYTMTIRVLVPELRGLPTQMRYKKLVRNGYYKRFKFLNELYKLDRPTYERVKEKLALDFTPPPPFFELRDDFERKRDIRRVSDEYCKKLKDEKIDKLKKKLKEEQKVFAKEKEEKQKWIDEQMARFNISEDVILNPGPRIHDSSYIFLD